MAVGPGLRLVFDHIHKTGGISASAAFTGALPAGSVSPHFNPRERPFPAGEVSNWHHVTGHFGHEYRHLVPHFGSATTATMVRDPAACIVSTYTFWRFNIPRDYGTHVAQAHDLGFSDFLRAFPFDRGFLNGESTFLAGDLRGDPDALARAALAPYAIVGVTPDLSGFVARVLERIDPEAAPRAADLVAGVETNASLGTITPSEDDLAYLAEHQAYDRALHAEALRRAAAPA